MSRPLPSPLILCGALLSIACKGPGEVATEASESTLNITGVSVTETAADATDTQTTVEPTSGTTSGACEAGQSRCVDVDTHQVCKNGTWADEPCDADQGCFGDGACQPCSCEASSCADAETLEFCNCFAIEPKKCDTLTACVEANGDASCQPMVCTPGLAECDADGQVVACNPTGTAYLPPVECDSGQLCDFGECLAACDVVAKNESSLGCEFWAVDMANVPPRDAYVFGVAISNPSADAPVKVVIYDRNNAGQEQKLAEATIQPRDVQIFPLSGTSNGDKGFYPGDAGFLGTGIASGRAFRIVSELPIVATQFNPLGGAKAATTDASLLLPTHTLGKDYYHLAWEKGLGAGSAMVIVATADNTVVTITSTVDTNAGMNGMPALSAGAPIVLPPLKKYDYVQVSSAGKDLSATKITSNAPVAVFGGHSCGQVPNTDVDYCDHLEEQIFPIDTWGSHFVAMRSPARATNPVEPMAWRVLASKPNTHLNFDPPVSIGDQYDLDAGGLVQFTSNGDFELTSNQPVLVGGYMYGCKATKIDACPGDPSMVLAVPVEQWLTDYVFLVDYSYTNDNVKIVRNKGQEVSLGCFGEVTEWTDITADYQSAVVNINPGARNCAPGTNTATGVAPFSIMVVGEAASTSYAYPGGLALKPINPG
jgi:hypothetical protein